MRMSEAGNQGSVLPFLPGHLAPLSCQLVKQHLVSECREISEKTPHSMLSYMLFSTMLCVCVRCPGPAPRDQPAGSQCRTVSEKYFTTVKPKISTP